MSSVPYNTIMLIAMIIGIMLILSGNRGAAVAECAYTRMPPPTMQWTRTDNVKCHAWALDTGRWFFRCNNNTFGVEEHGTLFQNLKSQP